MKKQGKADKMDESLGMRRGKEAGKSQSYASRRHESEGMHDAAHHHKAIKHHLSALHKMAKGHQSKNDRLDESLGVRRGKEAGKSQSYASRRHESRGAHK